MGRLLRAAEPPLEIENGNLLMKENWVVTWPFVRVSIYQTFEVENFNQAYQKEKRSS